MTTKAERFGPVGKANFIEELRGGARRRDACETLGVSRERVIAELEKDQRFADGVMTAEIEANELVEKALFDAAKSGNVAAIKVWLFNRLPHRWAERKKPKVGKPEDEVAESVAEILSRYPDE